MADPKIIIRITGDSKKFRRELDKIERESDKTIKELNKDGKKLTGQTLKESKKRIAISKRESDARIRNAKRFAAVLGVIAVAGIGKSIRDFATFEQGLAGVSKTTNIVGRELENLGKDITSLSISLGVSTIELLETSKAAGQLGVEGSKNILKFTEVITGLGKTTNIAGEQGAIALARLIKITGESTDNVDRLGSAIVDLGNNTAALEDQILFTATEIAGAGTVFGITAKQALGLAAAFSELAIRPELARSTVVRSFSEIQKAITAGGEQFEKLIKITGLAGDALEKTFAEDSPKVFALFLEGVGKLPKSEILPFLATFNLKGRLLEPTLSKLAIGSDLVAEKLDLSSKAYKDNAALTKELGIQLDTTASRAKQAKEEYEAISREIGKEFIPATEDALKSLRDITPFITENLIPALSLLIGFLAESVKGFKIFADAIGSVFSKFRESEFFQDNIITVGLDLFDANKDVEEAEKQLNEILEKGFEARKERHQRESAELEEFLNKQNEAKTEDEEEDIQRQADIDNLAEELRRERKEEQLEKEKEEREEKLELEQEQFDEDMELLGERLALALAQNDRAAIEEVGILQQKRISKAKIDELANKNEIKGQIVLAKSKAQIEQSIFDNSKSLGIALLEITGVNSKAIFLIEKAAAIGEAIVATNLAATKALAVPPAPNFALAAAAKLAGGLNIATIIATSIGQIKGAADGTVVSGGILGRDTEPFLLAKNEIVLPSKANPLSPDFEEAFGGGQEVSILIDLTDEASQFITVGQREDTTLGVQR